MAQTVSRLATSSSTHGGMYRIGIFIVIISMTILLYGTAMATPSSSSSPDVLGGQSSQSPGVIDIVHEDIPQWMPTQALNDNDSNPFPIDLDDPDLTLPWASMEVYNNDFTQKLDYDDPVYGLTVYHLQLGFIFLPSYDANLESTNSEALLEIYVPLSFTAVPNTQQFPSTCTFISEASPVDPIKGSVSTLYKTITSQKISVLLRRRDIQKINHTKTYIQCSLALFLGASSIYYRRYDPLPEMVLYRAIIPSGNSSQIQHGEWLPSPIVPVFYQLIAPVVGFSGTYLDNQAPLRVPLFMQFRIADLDVRPGDKIVFDLSVTTQNEIFLVLITDECTSSSAAPSASRHSIPSTMVENVDIDILRKLDSTRIDDFDHLFTRVDSSHNDGHTATAAVIGNGMTMGGDETDTPPCTIYDKYIEHPTITCYDDDGEPFLTFSTTIHPHPNSSFYYQPQLIVDFHQSFYRSNNLDSSLYQCPFTFYITETTGIAAINSQDTHLDGNQARITMPIGFQFKKVFHDFTYNLQFDFDTNEDYFILSFYFQNDTAFKDSLSGLTIYGFPMPGIEETIETSVPGLTMSCVASAMGNYCMFIFDKDEFIPTQDLQGTVHFPWNVYPHSSLFNADDTLPVAVGLFSGVTKPPFLNLMPRRDLDPILSHVNLYFTNLVANHLQTPITKLQAFRPYFGHLEIIRMATPTLFPPNATMLLQSLVFFKYASVQSDDQITQCNYIYNGVRQTVQIHIETNVMVFLQNVSPITIDLHHGSLYCHNIPLVPFSGLSLHRQLEISLAVPLEDDMITIKHISGGIVESSQTRTFPAKDAIEMDDILIPASTIPRGIITMHIPSTIAFDIPALLLFATNQGNQYTCYIDFPGITFAHIQSQQVPITYDAVDYNDITFSPYKRTDYITLRINTNEPHRIYLEGDLQGIIYRAAHPGFLIDDVQVTILAFDGNLLGAISALDIFTTLQYGYMIMNNPQPIQFAPISTLTAHAVIVDGVDTPTWQPFVSSSQRIAFTITSFLARLHVIAGPYAVQMVDQYCIDVDSGEVLGTVALVFVSGDGDGDDDENSTPHQAIHLQMYPMASLSTCVFYADAFVLTTDVDDFTAVMSVDVPSLDDGDNSDADDNNSQTTTLTATFHYPSITSLTPRVHVTFPQHGEMASIAVYGTTLRDDNWVMLRVYGGASMALSSSSTTTAAAPPAPPHPSIVIPIDNTEWDAIITYCFGAVDVDTDVDHDVIPHSHRQTRQQIQAQGTPTCPLSPSLSTSQHTSDAHGSDTHDNDNVDKSVVTILIHFQHRGDDGGNDDNDNEDNANTPPVLQDIHVEFPTTLPFVMRPAVLVELMASLASVAITTTTTTAASTSSSTSERVTPVTLSSTNTNSSNGNHQQPLQSSSPHHSIKQTMMVPALTNDYDFTLTIAHAYDDDGDGGDHNGQQQQQQTLPHTTILTFLITPQRFAIDHTTTFLVVDLHRAALPYDNKHTCVFTDAHSGAVITPLHEVPLYQYQSIVTSHGMLVESVPHHAPYMYDIRTQYTLMVYLPPMDGDGDGNNNNNNKPTLQVQCQFTANRGNGDKSGGGNGGGGNNSGQSVTNSSHDVHLQMNVDDHHVTPSSARPTPPLAMPTTSKTMNASTTTTTTTNTTPQVITAQLGEITSGVMAVTTTTAVVPSTLPLHNPMVYIHTTFHIHGYYHRQQHAMGMFTMETVVWEVIVDAIQDAYGRTSVSQLATATAPPATVATENRNGMPSTANIRLTDITILDQYNAPAEFPRGDGSSNGGNGDATPTTMVIDGATYVTATVSVSIIGIADTEPLERSFSNSKVAPHTSTQHPHRENITMNTTNSDDGWDGKHYLIQTPSYTLRVSSSPELPPPMVYYDDKRCHIVPFCGVTCAELCDHQLPCVSHFDCSSFYCNHAIGQCQPSPIGVF